MPWLLLLLAQPPAPTATDLIQKAAAYVAAYERRIGGLVAEETIIQRRLVGTGANMLRTVRSDYVVIRLSDRTWVPFRDVREVNRLPVGDHAVRLEQLFGNATHTSLQELSARLTAENARYNVAWQGNINMPYLALTFLRDVNVARFRYRLAERERVEGADAWRLDYQEIARPTLVRRDRTGADAPASGSLWLRESDGAVLRTKLHTDVGGAADVDVTFCESDSARILVPCTMHDRYSFNNEEILNATTYTNVKRFDVSVGTATK